MKAKEDKNDTHCVQYYSICSSYNTTATKKNHNNNSELNSTNSQHTKDVLIAIYQNDNKTLNNIKKDKDTLETFLWQGLFAIPKQANFKNFELACYRRWLWINIFIWWQKLGQCL